MMRPAGSTSGVFKLTLESWIELQAKLLEQERQSQLDKAVVELQGSTQELEARGVVLPRVTVLDVTTGLFGRTVITLGDHMSRNLPSHRFTPGDIVGVRLFGAGGGGVPTPTGGDIRSSYDASGVVTKVDEKSVSVALDAESGGSTDAAGGVEGRGVEFGDRVRLDKLADDVTFQRLKSTLASLKASRHGPASRLLQILFQGGDHAACVGGSPARTTDQGGWCTPQFALTVTPPPSQKGSSLSSSSSSSPDNHPGWHPYHPGLNGGQVSAITAALRSQDVCMIHGPPGTGKTTTVVEYILQEVVRGRRVLACAPSNVAVDNLLERLVAARGGGLKVIRLGHPARVSPLLQRHTLEAVLEGAEGKGLVADARRDLGRVGALIKKCRDKVEKRGLRKEERELRGEIREREERVLREALSGADVVLCTVTGAATRMLERGLGGGAWAGTTQAAQAASSHFDVCVIDEVAQAMEIAALIPVLMAPKLCLAGDHCQLAPTVTCDAAARGGLQLTLGDRLVALFGGGGEGGENEAHPAVLGGGGSSKAPSHPPPICPFQPTLPVVHMLTEQYRMHKTISDWSSGAVYHGRLTPHPSVASHRLSQLSHTHFPGGVAPAGAGAGAGAGGGGASGGGDMGEGDTAPVTVSASALQALRGAAVSCARESLLEAERGGGGDGEEGGGGKGGANNSSSSSKESSGKKPRAPPVSKSRVDATTASYILAQSDAPGVDIDLDSAALNAPLLFVDTAGCGLVEVNEEALGRGGGGGGTTTSSTSTASKPTSVGSKANLGEADIVVKHVMALIEGVGLRPSDIGVISPYSAQTNLLRALLHPRYPTLTVSTVDGFQGMEKEAIVLSCVRSNGKRAVGFLADWRRMNVAVTRARRHVCVIGDSETLGSDPFLAGLVEYAGGYGEVRTGEEYAEMMMGGGRGGGGGGGGGDYTLGDLAAGVIGVANNNNSGGGRGGGGGGSSSLAQQQQQSKALEKEREERKQAKATALLSAVRRQLKKFLKKCDELFGGEEGGASTLLALSPNDKGGVEGQLSLALPRDTPPFNTATCALSPLPLPPPPTTTSTTATTAATIIPPTILYPPALVGAPLPCVSYSPTTLNPLHRALVHEAADSLGVPHFSAGEGQGRYVAVWWAPKSVRLGVGSCSGGGGGVGGEHGGDTLSALFSPFGAESDVSEEEEEAAKQATVEAAAAAAATTLSVTAASPTPVSAPAASPQNVATAASDPPVPPSPPPPQVKSPLSMMAQLNADRLARAAAAAGAAKKGEASVAGKGGGGGGGGESEWGSLNPSPSPSGTATAAGTSGKTAKPPGGGKKGGEGGGGGGGGGKGGGGGGARKEFGIAVVPLKKVQATLVSGTGAEVGEDEDDALLDALIAASGTCPAKACTTKTHATGTTCKYCRLRFCIAHGHAEVHGCGDQARAAAKADWSGAGGRAALGIGAPMNKDKRATLARELHKKVDAAEKERAKGGEKKG